MLGTLPTLSMGAMETAMARAGVVLPIYEEMDTPSDERSRIISDVNQLIEISNIIHSRFNIKEIVPFTVLDSETLNGRVILCQNKHYIGINKSIFNLYEIFIQLVSAPYYKKLMRGEIIKVSLSAVKFVDVFDCATRLLCYPHPKLPGKVCLAARLMAQIAQAYILLHEICHAKNGHLQYIKMQRVTAFDEVVSLSAVDVDRNITLQTFEMDADSISYSLLIQLLLKDTYLFKNANLFNNIELLLILHFSLYSVMRVFDIYSFSYDNLWHRSHPTGFMRSHMMGSTLVSNPYILDLPIKQAEIVGMITNVAMAVEESVLFKTGHAKNFSAELQIIGDPGQFYVRSLLSRWALIREKLKPYLLGGSLAAAQEKPF